jgi:hypothetical protein
MKKRRESKKKVEIEEEIVKEIAVFENEKEEKLLNLLAEIVIKSTLKEFYETSDKIS